MIESAWPDLTVLARLAGQVAPHDPANAALFRGEEAFEPDVAGSRRWSKPSPEPRPDPAFRGLLLGSIDREAAAVAGMVARLADRVARSDRRPPILIAILRAGVPVASLLARRLADAWGEPIPVLAFSIFQGLGWDASALMAALEAHPGRPAWFVDGWTSGGGVAGELRASFARWRASGRPDFTDGRGPRLAVLVDPRGLADASATRADRFIPSAGFAAPETLGFSRGFVGGDGGMFLVYQYPRTLVDPAFARSWIAIGDLEATPADLDPDPIAGPEPSPVGWRVHVNEVVRALINRDPREVWFRDPEAIVSDRMAPVVHLARRRGLPIRFDRPEVAAWGALAAARMVGPRP